MAAGQITYLKDSPLQPFFIVGFSRSGTTWLQRILNSHPEILCRGEGAFFGRSLKGHERMQSLYASLAHSESLKIWHDRRVWTEGKFENFLPKLVRLTVDYLFTKELESKPGAKVVGDKTPHFVSYLDEVHLTYPEAKIIHILRDGRDVAISNLYNLWRRSKDQGGPLQVRPKILRKRDMFLADPEAFLARRESLFPEPILRNLAQRWNHTVKKGIEEGNRYFGERYTEIKYETLLEEPHAELSRLLNFLGVRKEQTVIKPMVEENSFEKLSGGRHSGEEDLASFFRKGISGDWRNYFTDHDKQIFEEEAGGLLTQLGYEEGAYNESQPG